MPPRRSACHWVLPRPAPRSKFRHRSGSNADSDLACPQRWFHLRMPWTRCPGPGAAAMDKDNISLCAESSWCCCNFNAPTLALSSMTTQQVQHRFVKLLYQGSYLLLKSHKKFMEEKTEGSISFSQSKASTTCF